MSEIPIAPMHRIARKSGADRVSMKAAEELGRILEELALEICKEAQNYMMHSKRKTLHPDDIKTAARKLYSRRNRR
jgi:histone H3/H4